MPNNTNSYGRYRQADTETFLKMMMLELVIKAHAKGDISDSTRDYFIAKSLNGLDELEECYSDMLTCFENKQYHRLLARIETAEAVIEQEMDMRKREFYVKKMRVLTEQLKRLS